MTPPEDACPKAVVLDTNVVLDLLVFADASTEPLQSALGRGRLVWLATAAMRDEFECVLGYPQIASRLALAGAPATRVLARFDRQARIVAPPPRAPVTCSDPDDQKFIDLAVSRRCLLLTKDAAVLKLRKKLAGLEVAVHPALAPP
ncbi:MAG: putative toxin-antitoxin system toxin component, PIN family [Ramlibacter sp.]|nr:putative toxin-antitoxin system toxin component, PIN family [Ramlibacter sp.]